MFSSVVPVACFYIDLCSLMLASIMAEIGAPETHCFLFIKLLLAYLNTNQLMQCIYMMCVGCGT